MFLKLDKHVRYGDAALSGFVNIEGAWKIVEEVGKPLAGPNFAKIEQFAKNAGLGPWGLKAIGGTIGVEERGFRERSYVLDSRPAGLVGAPLTDDDLRVIPVDAKMLAASKWKPTAIYDQLLASILSMVDDEQVKNQIKGSIEGAEQMLQIDIRKDLIEPLGDLVVLHDGPAQIPFLGGFTLVLSVRDAARLRTGIAKLTKGLNQFIDSAAPRNFKPQFQTVVTDGRSVTFFNFAVVAPAVCVTDKHLVFTLFPQSTNDVVDRLTSPGSKSILDDKAFASARAKVGVADTLHYENGTWLMEQLYSVGLLIARSGALALPNVGIELETANLPPISLIRNRLFPSIGFSRTDREGTYSETYGPLPLGGSAVVLAGAAVGGVGMVAYLGLRNAEAGPARAFPGGDPRAVPKEARPAPKREFEKRELEKRPE